MRVYSVLILFWGQNLKRSALSWSIEPANFATNRQNPQLTWVRSSSPRKLCACPSNAQPEPRNKRWSKAAVAAVALIGIMSSSAHAEEVSGKMRYWSIINSGPQELVVSANEGLMDHAVGTVNTMYYDNSGGARFSVRDFYSQWKELRDYTRQTQKQKLSSKDKHIPSDIRFDTRDGTVKGLKWLISSLDDPFSKYLTREELKQELVGGDNGFLGLGAIVEPPGASRFRSSPPLAMMEKRTKTKLLTSTQVANLPRVTAVAPDSPAERSGIVVGDYIVSVGSDNFLGLTRDAVTRALRTRYHAENYVGYPDVMVAKPRIVELNDVEVTDGYRLSRVRLPTALVEPYEAALGDSVVHYSLITPKDSIFDRRQSVGYIRLTRFSRASTAGYLKAIQDLDAAGATSYIIDLRNNYGGVIQEAMLTASTLLRDPHAVLCYTMNSRGGFTPHDVEEYIVDARYPGYLLSSEPKAVTLNQVKREDPSIFYQDGWVPPSSYVSLHEQMHKRGIHMALAGPNQWNTAGTTQEYQARAQKKVVILINEGTASSAEVFASSLRDNGRAILVGAKTYGKGLIQHTFPMPDGGGLRLTVAEYLTPSLKHVTNVGLARYENGQWVGGGIRPNVQCESKQGIPQNVGADFCVGVALDELEAGESGEASM